MSHTTSQKIKLLVIYDILCRLTDEEHALNTDELINLLGEKGIQVDPRVLKSDIDMLNDYGYEVLSYKKKYYYYYVASRQFESAEIAMLSDVVSASKLNANRKKTLIGKLAGTLGNNKANVMMKNVLSFEKPKRTNAHIIYSIDRIDAAINDKKKVSFLYFSLDYTGNKVYRKDGKRYLVNPLVMIWNQDNYYLLCYDDKHPDLASYLRENYPDNNWNTVTIWYILSNERYIGDSLWQKTYTPNELPLKKKRNKGNVPKFYCESTHEPIIDKATFEKVRAFKKAKGDKYYKSEPATKEKTFDWNIMCRCCGWKFRRRKRTFNETWICSRKGTQKEVCKTRTYTDRELERAFVSVYNTFRQNERLLLGETISMLQTLKAKVNAGNDEIGEIDRKIAELTAKNSMYTNLYSSGVIDESVYFEKVDQIKDSITELRSRRLRLINEDENEACIEKLRKLKRILEESPESITAFDKAIFQKIVENVYAEEDGALTFELLGGLELKKAVGV